ncbi:hypothetical protein CDL15_Pgr021611 [Punica granatum]|uniref:J domain-containing protein n=1 Tax=Punica granatum TaxID=22663 RepID=A0A218WRG9_PUNGR|nr:hypothetical protein CDL15_Pgr021611 [Punica granatum]
METNKDEALKAKEIAEKRFAERDFAGAKSYALKAKKLWPGLDGISQMVATFEVYTASALRVNGEIDHYSILGLKPSADKYAVKRQYRKLAVLLHPDKNKSMGADGAFKLVSEAWTLLSDSAKRSSYDRKRNQQQTSLVSQTNLSAVHTAGVPGHSNLFNTSSSQGRLDTFWTVCTSCKVQYEYLRKYVNKRLSCKNCRGIFIAVETGTAPINGSFPYCPYTYMPSNGFPNHGSEGVQYVTTSTTYYPGNGVAGYHSGQGYEYVSNMSFQWSSHSATSAVIVGSNGSSSAAAGPVYQGNGKLFRANKDRSGSNGRQSNRSTLIELAPSPVDVNGSSGANKPGRPDKRRKVVVGADFRNGSDGTGVKYFPEAGPVNGNSNVWHEPKLSVPIELPTRRCSAVPAFDARKLLIEKARTEIRKKLENIKKAEAAAAAAAAAAVAAAVAAAAAAVKEEEKAQQSQAAPVAQKGDNPGHHSKANRSGPVSITVPDPDFHDFDRDRSEESFKPKQIWALYDEEDGMPRLYCLIREIISMKPFKILITYLSSKSDSEFGAVNWLDCGFTKSCGNFRAYNSDVIEQVNIFSHLLSKEKAGRGGCVRIYPRSGDIWAVYRNWSPKWNRSTPAKVRHQYEMVEVVDDYSEELGVCVTPLVKLAGYKTVYQRDKDALRWIPRREMLRFSHQVPSWSLKDEAGNLPDGCWDLDPAATPDELLNDGIDIEVEVEA